MIISEELKKMKSLMGVSVTKEPNLNDEMDELQRVAQYLSREEDINVTIDDISTAFRKTLETPLNDKICRHGRL